jgi:hypothetical protein
VGFGGVYGLWWWGEGELGLVEDVGGWVDDMDVGVGGGFVFGVSEGRGEMVGEGELVLECRGEEGLNDGGDSFKWVRVIFGDGDGVEAGESAFFGEGDVPGGWVEGVNECVGFFDDEVGLVAWCEIGLWSRPPWRGSGGAALGEVFHFRPEGRVQGGIIGKAYLKGLKEA